MAVSRSREYQADESRRRTSRTDPDALASALRKLEVRHEAGVRRRPSVSPAEAHLFIMNPLAGRARPAAWRTCSRRTPPTEQRIERLTRSPSIRGGALNADRPQHGPQAHRRPWSTARTCSIVVRGFTKQRPRDLLALP